MKFFHHLLNKHSTSDAFDKIQRYDDLKQIVSRALDSEENYNLLFVGPPSSAKTLFLQGILELRKDAIYFDATNTTSRILDVLEEKRPKIILLDELDKMGKSWQNQLLNFMESGRVDVEQQRKQYHFEIMVNNSRLSKPLQSRFRKLFLPRYTEEQFLEVPEKVLFKTSPSISSYIGVQVWKYGGDIRDCISIGKLVRKNDGPEEIAEIVGTITKYGAAG